jgi:hypothetical protein
MVSTRTTLFAVLTLVAGGIIAGAVTGSLGPQEPRLERATAGNTDAAIEILEVRSFVLDEPYTHWWRKEQPEVRSGLILVLRTDPELVRARQSAVPVLYVGAETAERCNHAGGNLVALVPAPVDARGRIDLDLSTTPIFFGRPDLPERIDAQIISSELALAVSQGVGPAPLSQRALAGRRRGSRPDPDVLYAHDRDELDLSIADLIEFYSPEETDLVDLLRMPKTQ